VVGAQVVDESDVVMRERKWPSTTTSVLKEVNRPCRRLLRREANGAIATASQEPQIHAEARRRGEYSEDEQQETKGGRNHEIRERHEREGAVVTGETQRGRPQPKGEWDHEIHELHEKAEAVSTRPRLCRGARHGFSRMNADRDSISGLEICARAKKRKVCITNCRHYSECEMARLKRAERTWE